MPDHLVLTLAAPFGAMGDLAGHERRGTAAWPARSAILGLLGGALGVERDDPEGQAALGAWRMAVATLAFRGRDARLGLPLRDYHTVQTVPASVRAPATRREALDRGRREGRLSTTLTTRDYVQGCAFLVALWGGDLAGAQAALRRPAFAPYLGRRSCPLAAPLDPRVVAAETPVAALLAPREVPEWLAGAKPVRVASDAFDGVAAHPGYMVESRWDEPLDRSLWHFARREVYVLPLVPAGGPS